MGRRPLAVRGAAGRRGGHATIVLVAPEVGARIVRLARAMLLAFGVAMQLDRRWALHNDGNKLNDRLDNLRWGNERDIAEDVRRRRLSRPKKSRGPLVDPLAPRSSPLRTSVFARPGR